MRHTGFFLLLLAAAMLNCVSLTAQWVRTDTLCRGSVNDLTVANGYLYAADNNGLYRSSDHGMHWSKSDTGIATKVISAIGTLGTLLFAGTPNDGIFISSDNGMQWSGASGGLLISNVTAFASCPSKESGSNDLYACFSDTLLKAAVYRTADSGVHWSAAGTGITNGDTRSLVACDSDLFVGSMGGVFRSTNNGTAWTPKNSGLSVTYVVTLLANDIALFAGTMTGGAFRSTDHGENWEQINNGLTNTYVNAFASAGPQVLFTGTGWSGVFFSSNNGAQWRSVNTGLTTSQINTLAVDPEGKYLYAGTDVGVWYRPIDEMLLGTDGPNAQFPMKMELLQNFPNPFNPATTIKYAIPVSAHVKLTIHDLLGREAAALVDEEQSAGWKEVQWNAGTEANGLYFYRLSAGNFTETKKMMLLK